MHRCAVVRCPLLARGVDRARGEALEAEAAGAAPHRFGCVILREARIPVHPGIGAVVGSCAGGSRICGEGAVLLVGAGAGSKGVCWPGNGGRRGGGCVRGCGLATPGHGKLATVRGRPVSLWGGELLPPG